jgi:pimeloyl-ACP methyl ester carboxylesterase
MTPILYLHGFASGPASSKAGYFRRFLEQAGMSVEIPDLAAGDFEHLTLTGQLAVIERAAAGRPVFLIGSSMGGYLAALFAARHAEVARVVLLAPAFGFARRWRSHLGEEAVARWRESGKMEVFHYGENRLMNLGYQLLADADPYEDYPEFRQPALIFHGSRDDVVPVRYSEEFAAGRPNAHLEVLDSGHELTDVLDYMAPRVRDFLR